MDQERKQPKTEGRFPKFARFIFWTALVVFLLSCLAFLVLENVQMKRRLTFIEERMVTAETIEKFCATIRRQSDTDDRADTKTLLLRRRRSLGLSLQSLEKRLKVLELR